MISNKCYFHPNSSGCLMLMYCLQRSAPIHCYECNAFEGMMQSEYVR